MNLLEAAIARRRAEELVVDLPRCEGCGRFVPRKLPGVTGCQAKHCSQRCRARVWARKAVVKRHQAATVRCRRQRCAIEIHVPAFVRGPLPDFCSPRCRRMSATESTMEAA